MLAFNFAFDFDLYNFNLTLPVSLVCHSDSSSAAAAAGAAAATTVRTPFVKRTVPLGTRRHTNELSDGKLLRCGKPQTHTQTHTHTHADASRFTLHAQRLALAFAPHKHNVVVAPPPPPASPLNAQRHHCSHNAWQFGNLVGCLLVVYLCVRACIYAPPHRSRTL